jgi:hypothetical protein
LKTLPYYRGNGGSVEKIHFSPHARLTFIYFRYNHVKGKCDVIILNYPRIQFRAPEIARDLLLRLENACNDRQHASNDHFLFKFIQTPISDKNQTGEKFPGKRASALSWSRKKMKAARRMYTHTPADNAYRCMKISINYGGRVEWFSACLAQRCRHQT